MDLLYEVSISLLISSKAFIILSGDSALAMGENSTLNNLLTYHLRRGHIIRMNLLFLKMNGH
jgi:hypothetical protein